MANPILSMKTYIALVIIIVSFVCMSWLAFSSISQMQGNGRVINYAGIVRGATQRLVKKELNHKPDNALIVRLDGIVKELLSGQGPNDLTVLQDSVYLSNMKQVQQQWELIKQEIKNYREGADASALYELSEDYFILVDKSVSCAENFSANQLKKSRQLIIFVNIFFAVFVTATFVYYIRTVTLARRTAQLQKIAYFDPLTQMPNRASCEREIDYLTKNTPTTPVAVFMFDMNNLKKVNDQLGHASGDKIIADFARILKMVGQEYGFIGRFGGDEFLGIFTHADDAIAEKFITQLNEKIVSNNLLHVNQLEKLSFAAGYCIGNLAETPLSDLIYEADRRMYSSKRQMKEDQD